MTNNPQTAIAIFVVVLVVGLGLILLWPLRQAERANKRHDAEKKAAREALNSTPGTTFHNGALAAIDGAEDWHNPHCGPGDSLSQYHDWDAGWCYGRQMLLKMGGQP